MPSDSSGNPHKSSSLDLDDESGAILGYVCAVNTATLSFMIVVARKLVPLDFISFALIFFDGLFSWFAISVVSVVPVFIAYRIARKRRIHNIIYYIGWGAVIGAMFTFPYVHVTDDDSRSASSFLKSYLWEVPILMAAGTVGGATFWYKAGRHLSGSSRAVSTRRVDVLLRMAGIGVTAFFCLVVPGYVVTPLVQYFWSQSHCTTETREKISNLSGFDFETTRTACDTSDSTTWVRLSVSPAGQRKETLLFEFIPDKDDDIPTISVADSSHIVIVIPVVSSVRFQMHDWQNVHIEYRIGRVIYG
jgi:hypothetical protein